MLVSMKQRPAFQNLTRAIVDLCRSGLAPEVPRLHVRTKAGRWAGRHAARLQTGRAGTIAVIIDEPSPGDLAPILMAAYGLTKQEQTLTTLVCRGASTREIGVRLRITANTVQDHLKSIFDKTGVRSRRALVATIFKEQYLPRAKDGRPIRPSGSSVDVVFDESAEDGA